MARGREHPGLRTDPRRRRPGGGRVVAALAALLAGAPWPASADRVAVAWDRPPATASSLRALDTAEPWVWRTPVLAVEPGGVVRVAEGRVWHVSSSGDRISAIAPDSWTLERTYPLAPGSEPRDVAVVGPDRAYVTRRSATHLARLDLASGALVDAVDLGPFADADGIPDMNTMAEHEGRLFVQLQRRDDLAGGFAPPPLLAVVDLVTEQLIDVDPATPGVQAIELQGTAPKFKMQVVPETRRLFVGASGGFFDAGGIEMIDLDALQSLGLVVAERSGLVGADLGAFVMVTPDEGYLVFSTDLLLSSHLTRFSVSGGVQPGELHVALDYLVPELLLDAAGSQLFWPEPAGLHVFDTATGVRLTRDPIPLDGVPSDLALVRDATPVPALSTWGALALLAALAAAALTARAASGSRAPGGEGRA